MGLETGTYISDLVATNPAGSDHLSQGDDHIRLLKSTVTTTFPSVTGAVTATQAELNLLDGVTATTAELNILDGVTATTAELNFVGGVTSDIQSQIDLKAPLASPTFTGTVTAGTVTITGTATVPTPSASTDAATKQYVDDNGVTVDSVGDAEIKKTWQSSGTWTLAGYASTTPAAGVYQVSAEHSGIDLQLYNGGWVGASNGIAGIIICDGSNVRIYNSTSITHYAYYKRLA